MPRHKCDNCEKVFTEAALAPIEKLTERLTPGGTVPSGQCPACGCLCYPLPEASPEKPQKAWAFTCTVVGNGTTLAEAWDDARGIIEERASRGDLEYDDVLDLDDGG